MRSSRRLTLTAAVLWGSLLALAPVVHADAPAPATPPAKAETGQPAAEGEKPKKLQQRDQLTYQQSKIAAEMNELEERMFRLSEALKSLEPENSSRLMLGLRYAREELILHQMQEIQEVLDKLALDEAVVSQKQLMSKLQRLQELLLSKDLDFQMRLARLRQLRQVLRKLDTVIAEEDREKRASELAAKKAKELKALARKRVTLEQLIKRQTAHLDSGKALAQLAFATKPATELADLGKAQAVTRKDTQTLAAEKPSAEDDSKPEPPEKAAAEPAVKENPAKDAAAKDDAPKDDKSNKGEKVKGDEKDSDSTAKKDANENDTAKNAKDKKDKDNNSTDDKDKEAPAGKRLVRAAAEMGSAVESLSKQEAKQAVAPMEVALADLKAELAATNQREENLKKELAREKFKRLERAQAKNRSENEDVANMARLLGDSGAGAMAELLRASGSMGSAGSALGQMQAGSAADDQEAALKSLKYARAQLAAEAKRLLDDLLQQMKRTVMDGLATMLEKQIEIREATALVGPRLKGGSRLAQTSVKGLATREGKLVDTASELVGMVEETGFGIALPAALTVIRDAMQEVQVSLEASDASPPVVEAEKQIEAELLALIGAMKQLPGPGRPGNSNNNGGDGQEQRERELNRIAAELRIIKMLQLHVNRGTTDADQRKLALKKLPPELRKKIEDLRYRQEDIRDVTDKLAEERGEEVTR